MPKGVKIVEEVIGSGAEARRGMTVAANVRIFLNRGDEVTAEYPQAPRTVIDLGRRDTIAGIRYGIEGMRVGGRRSLVVSPHLAFGSEGMGDFVPPNAVIRCEVELLEVGNRGSIPTSVAPPGRVLHLFLPGQAAEGIPRCQVGLHEIGEVTAFITRPIPGHGWRGAPMRMIQLNSVSFSASELLDEALGLPDRVPGDCLSIDQLWSDSSEAANGITRDRESNSICVSICVRELDKELASYSVRIDSKAWLDSAMNRFVSELLDKSGS